MTIGKMKGVMVSRIATIIAPLIMLLRRFATEAAREEARMFCDDLVDGLHTDRDDRMIAA